MSNRITPLKDTFVGQLTFLLFTAVLFGVVDVSLFGQQPSPAPVKLNPEASKQYLAIENQEKEIVRQANETLQQLEREKAALLIGANVPRADLAKVICAADAGGMVTCSRKSESGVASQEPGEKPKAEGSAQKAENKSP